MKKWYTLFVSCLMVHLVSGQSYEPPKREFVFMAESSHLTIGRADTARLAVHILKSKAGINASGRNANSI